MSNLEKKSQGAKRLGRPNNVAEFAKDLVTLGASRRAREKNLLVQRDGETPLPMGINRKEGIRNAEITLVLVGPIASGKTTASDLLLQQGYEAFTYGEQIL